MSKDNSARIVAFGIAFAIVGLIFAAGYARADTFNERFPAESPKLEAPIPAGQWGIKLVLVLDGKIARAIPYNEETYPTGEACKAAVLADLPLQNSMQAAAGEATKQFGENAAVGIVCAMHLD